MYRQFNIQQFYVLPTPFIYVLCVDLRTNSINWLVCITETECVHCAVRTGSLYTASLTFSNSTFCPHSVFMCFVLIWEQTAIISLYNWLVCIIETECVYCAVRTGYLYSIIQVNLSLQWNNPTHTNVPLPYVIHGAKFISRGDTPQIVQLKLAALSMAHKKRSYHCCLPACLSAWPSSSQRDRKSKQSLHITTLCSQLEPATRSDCPCFNLKIPCLHPGRAACMHLPAQVPPSISSVVLLQSCISVAFLTIMKWQWYTQCLFYASLFNSIFQIKPLLNLSSIIFNLHPFHSHRFLKKRNCGKTRAQCTAHKITLALCVWSTDFTRR